MGTALEYIAGISYSETNAQIAILKMQNLEPQIVYLEAWEKGDDVHDTWFLDRLLSKKIKWFRKVTKVSVALDNSSVVLHSFPLDTSLKQVDQNAQVQWELSNFIPQFQPKEYINEVHILRGHAREQVSDVLVVAARRTSIYRIQQRLAEEHFDLHLVDTAFFDAQHALLFNYPEVKTQHAIFLSVGNDRVDAGILRMGNLSFYRYIMHSSSEEISTVIDECLKVSPAAVYVYGTKVTEHFLKELQERVLPMVTRLNPFRRIPFDSSYRDLGGIAGEEHRFAECVGAALRRG